MAMQLKLSRIGELSILRFDYDTSHSLSEAKEVWFTRAVDDKSTDILHAAATGRHFQEAILTVSGVDSQTNYLILFRYIMKGAYASTYEDDGYGSERFNLEFYQLLIEEEAF